MWFAYRFHWVHGIQLPWVCCCFFTLYYTCYSHCTACGILKLHPTLLHSWTKTIFLWKLGVCDINVLFVTKLLDTQKRLQCIHNPMLYHISYDCYIERSITSLNVNLSMMNNICMMWNFEYVFLSYRMLHVISYFCDDFLKTSVQ